MSDLGLEEAGVGLVEGKRAPAHDAFMSVGPGMYVAGDAADGLQFTHIADYQGRVAVRNALGVAYPADLSAVPRTTFTDPETSSVGLTKEEAEHKEIDVFEVTQDFSTTARGYSIEGASGHVSAVIDRQRKTLVGAFAACPGASELIMEAVLAIKLSIPISVLADAVHLFPLHLGFSGISWPMRPDRSSDESGADRDREHRHASQGGSGLDSASEFEWSKIKLHGSHERDSGLSKEHLQLGLEPKNEDGGGLWFEFAQGTWPYVYKTGSAGTAKNTP